MFDRLVKFAHSVKPTVYHRGDVRNGVWTTYTFQVEPYGYDFMLRTAQRVLNDAVQVDLAVTAPVAGAPETDHSRELHAAQLCLTDCPAFMEETGVIALGVVMGDTHLPKRTVMKILWYNQTGIIHLHAMGQTGRHYFNRFIGNLLEEKL